MLTQDCSIPVIAIDGGAGTGKGTARAKVAGVLGFHELDSGVLYRALGFQAEYHGCATDNVDALVVLATVLDIRFMGSRIILDGIDRTKAIRSDEAGKAASMVARIPEVRRVFLQRQLSMRTLPGLVADGRDMGKIFDTPYRFFIVTDPKERARRRIKQFQQLGIIAEYDTILTEILARDESDQNNPANPLAPQPDAMIIDNTFLTSDDVRNIILNVYRKRICK